MSSHNTNTTTVIGIRARGSMITQAAADHQLTIDAIGRQESTASSCGGITPFAKRPTPLLDGRWYQDDAAGAATTAGAIPLSAKPSAFATEDDMAVAADEDADHSSTHSTSGNVTSRSSIEDCWGDMFAPPQQPFSAPQQQRSPSSSVSSSRTTSRAYLPSATYAPQLLEQQVSPSQAHHRGMGHRRTASGGFINDPYQASVFGSQQQQQPFMPEDGFFAPPQQQQFQGGMGSRESSEQDMTTMASAYAPIGTYAAVSSEPYATPAHYALPQQHVMQRTSSNGQWATQQQQHDAAWEQQQYMHWQQQQQHDPETCGCESCAAAAAVRARERAAPYVPQHHHYGGHQSNNNGFAHNHHSHHRHAAAAAAAGSRNSPQSFQQELHRQVAHQRASSNAALPTDVTVLAALSGHAPTQFELRAQQHQHQQALMQAAVAANNAVAAPIVLRFVPPQLPPLVLVTVISETSTADEANLRYLAMAARWFHKIAAVEHLFVEPVVDAEGNVVESAESRKCPVPSARLLAAFEAAAAASRDAAGVGSAAHLTEEERSDFRAWVQAARAWWLHHFEHAQTPSKPHTAHPQPAASAQQQQPLQTTPAQQHHYGFFGRGGSAAAAVRGHHHGATTSDPHSAVNQVSSSAPFLTHAAPPAAAAAASPQHQSGAPRYWKRR